MTDWQPGDPLYERGRNWTDRLPMFELKLDDANFDDRASWPVPFFPENLDTRDPEWEPGHP
jgi:hypothetical protein